MCTFESKNHEAKFEIVSYVWRFVWLAFELIGNEWQAETSVNVKVAIANIELNHTWTCFSGNINNNELLNHLVTLTTNIWIWQFHLHIVNCVFRILDFVVRIAVRGRLRIASLSSETSKTMYKCHFKYKVCF